MNQKRRILFIALIVFISQVLSYGYVGHEITAAIGQRFLSPKALMKVRELLPKKAHGNLSYIAAWADKVKRTPQYKFTSPMHFISPPNDYPPSHCSFSWTPGKYDLINAIHNYSNRLDPNSDLSFLARAEALRFLVHFIGDLHQPLHITSRDRGGNGSPALFEGHHTNLHFMWDSSIIYKQIRELHANSTFDHNLTEDNPELTYNGSFYDPYVTHIVNLITTIWRDELSSWTICNEDLDSSFEYPLSGQNNFNQFPFSSKNDFLDYSELPSMKQISQSAACPEYWAIQLNALNCRVVYNGYDPKSDLSIGAYYDRIVNGKVIEKLLAIAGIRIATVLNTIFL